jgi:hypothetical protein
MGAGYIRQEYGNAVARLCTDPREIRPRLEACVLDFLLFAGDPGTDMPPVLADRVREMYERVTSGPAADDEGTAAASVWLLSEAEASRLAADILELSQHLEAAYQRPEQWMVEGEEG